MRRMHRLRGLMRRNFIAPYGWRLNYFWPDFIATYGISDAQLRCTLV
jgi:hypothetical protein